MYVNLNLREWLILYKCPNPLSYDHNAICCLLAKKITLSAMLKGELLQGEVNMLSISLWYLQYFFSKLMRHIKSTKHTVGLLPWGFSIQKSCKVILLRFKKKSWVNIINWKCKPRCMRVKFWSVCRKKETNKKRIFFLFNFYPLAYRTLHTFV